MTQFKGKTRQQVYNDGQDVGWVQGFKDGYKTKAHESSEAIAVLIDKAYQDGVQVGWDARKETVQRPLVKKISTPWAGNAKKKEQEEMFWRRSTNAKLTRLKKAMNEFLTDFDGQIWTETAADGTKTVKIWYVNRRDKQTGTIELGQVLVFEEEEKK